MGKQKLVVRSVRLDAELNRRVEQAARQSGFVNPSAFIREAVKRFSTEYEKPTDAEERIAASVERILDEIRKVRRVQHAVFAFTDAQTKMLLTCIAEPPKEIYDQAVARGKLRYDRFLKSVGMGLAGDSGDAMKLLLGHGEQD